MLDNRALLFLLFLIFIVVVYGMSGNNHGGLINVDEESGVGEVPPQQLV